MCICSVLGILLAAACCGEPSARPACRTVTLAPGDNFIDATVVITDAVRYVSATGAKSRVVGARVLRASDFRKVTDPLVLSRIPEEGRGNVHVCDFRSRIDAPAVFIGGRIGELARWPNAGEWAYVSSGDVVCRGVKTGSRYTGCAFVLSDPRAKRWDFASGVRMKGYWTHDWAFLETRAGSFGPVNGTNDVVTFSSPISYGLLAGHTSGGHAKRRYYAFDLLEELDASGEYFYDHAEGKLYIAAPEGIDRLGEIAVCDSEGPVFQVRDASGVEFVGVDIAYRKDGFLKLSGARNLLVEDCNFTCCGASYAVEASGAERCVIRNTKLSVMGAGGVLLDGGDRPTLRRGENLIENCKVLHFGIIKRTYAPAVRLAGVGNTVRGCELAYAPHMAVAPVCNYGLFEFNDVHDVLLETGDCGAFYTGRNWFKGQGQVFRYNHIHDLGKLGGSSCAIYFDDCQCGGEVYGNVIENVARGMLIGGGRDHIVHDNVFRNCGIGVSIDCRGLVWKAFVDGTLKLDEDAMKEVRFTESPWKEAFPRMAHYLDVPAEKYAPFGNEIFGNLFLDCPGTGNLIRIGKEFFNFGKGDDKIGPLLPRIRIENNYSASTGEKEAGGPDDRAPETIVVIPEKVAWPLAHDSHVFEKLPGLMKVPFGRILAAADDDGRKLLSMEKGGERRRIDSMPLACHEVEAVKGRIASLLPDDRNFKLVWHDEFDGTALDDSKWSFRTNFWGRRAHWFAAPEDGCVELKDGVVHLMVRKLPNGQFVSPQLQTGELMWDLPRIENPRGFWPLDRRQPPKFVHKYGYYECRCRLQKKAGWWSAFWMQSEQIGCTLDPAISGIEHDIMESFDPGSVIVSTFHRGGYGADHRAGRIPADYDEPPQFKGKCNLAVDTETFHTFGLLWEPSGYAIYVDGRLRGCYGKNVSHIPEFILLSTECKWYRNNRMTGKGVPELEEAVAAGDDFVADYVRVYDLVP